MLELFGLDLKSQARGEIDALNNRRTGFDDWDLGDRFRSAITGISREQLEQKAGEMADQRLTDLYQPQADVNARNLMHLTADFQGVKGKTESEIKAELGSDKSRAAALQRTLAENPDMDPGALAPTSQLGTIVQAGSKATQTAKQEETRRLEGRADNLLMMQMLQNNRQSDRQFQLQMAQNDYNNRRLDMQDARAERRDRQAMIMQLMKGLAQMGQGIAI